MATAPASHGLATVPETEPRREPDGHYEIVDGQVRETPRMGAYEAEIASILQSVMGPIARSNGLGRVVTETLFRIDPQRNLSRRPDVAFVSRDRWPIDRRAPRSAAWEVVPDLAIEIISPNNRTVDDIQKVDDYFQAGSRMVWVVHPNVSKIYVYQSPTAVTILALGDELIGGEVVPGFRLALESLFGE